MKNAQHPLLFYAVSLAFVAAAFLLQLVQVNALWFVGAIVLSAHTGQFNTGIFATACSIVAMFLLTGLQLDLVLVTVIGVMVSQLSRRSPAHDSSTATRLQAVLDSMTEGLMMANPQSKLVYHNPASTDLHGYNDAGEGLTIIQHLSPNFEYSDLQGNILPVNQWPMARALRGERFTDVEIRVRRLDSGREFTGSYNGTPVYNKDGEFILAIVTLRDITQQKKVEKALHASEERFRLATEAMQGMIYDWDLNTGAMWRSQKLTELTGYQENEIPKVATWWHQQIHADDYAQTQVDYQAALAEHLTGINAEYRVRHKDGRMIWVWDHSCIRYNEVGNPIRIVGCTISIDERKLAQERTRTLYELTAELFKALTPQDVIQITLACVSTTLNAHSGSIGLLSADGTTVEVTAYPSREGLTPYLRLPLEIPTPASDVIRSGKPLWVKSLDEYQTLYPAFAQPVVDFTGSRSGVSLPLVIQGKTAGTLGIGFAHDRDFSPSEREFMLTIAQLCSQALERARLYETERQAREEAEKANRIKLQFLGMISHELRTPLTSIKGFITTLLADDLEWDETYQREFLNIANDEADKLTYLVEQLLDLSRLQAGRLSIMPQRQPFDAILQSAMPQLHTLTNSHVLRLDIEEDVPQVVADADRVAQVISNLVGNAVKFSPGGTTITVHAAINDGMMQVDVSDQGMGIPREAREEIFEAFKQVNQRFTGQTRGAGLGLAICKGLIEAHGGRIWVQDRDGAGATISFTLPVGK